MVEAEDAVHADNVEDDKIREHDVEAHVAKLFIVAGEVSVEAAVEVTHALDRLEVYLVV